MIIFICLIRIFAKPDLYKGKQTLFKVENLQENIIIRLYMLCIYIYEGEGDLSGYKGDVKRFKSIYMLYKYAYICSFMRCGVSVKHCS